MPGIDFNRLRAEITMEQVLNLLGFEPSSRTDDQWYGRCPLHESTSTTQPNVLGESEHQAVLLPQVPQQRKSN